MVWTTPRTWTDGELVTASLMNTHVRDNLNAVFTVNKMKGSDETVSASTTLQDDADFFFTVAAAEKWAVDMAIKLDTTTTGDWKFNFTVPAGTTYQFSPIYSPTATVVDWSSADFTISAQTSTAQGLRIQAFFLVGGTAGTVQFQWAQGTASGNTIVKAGSWMTAVPCV